MYDVFARLIYERKKMRLKPKYQVLLNLLLLLLLKKKILNVSDLAKKSDYDSKI